MKTLNLTKNQVIKALKTEPLRAGAFFNTEKRDSFSDTPAECRVCAVGAVLRNSLGKKILKESNDSQLGDLAEGYCQGQYIDYNSQELLKEKNYLGALSNYFEYLMKREKSKHASAAVVERLVNFVNKNFPNKFTAKYKES